MEIHGRQKTPKIQAKFDRRDRRRASAAQPLGSAPCRLRREAELPTSKARKKSRI
jgi:hypothetical protein